MSIHGKKRLLLPPKSFMKENHPGGFAPFGINPVPIQCYQPNDRPSKDKIFTIEKQVSKWIGKYM